MNSYTFVDFIGKAVTLLNAASVESQITIAKRQMESAKPSGVKIIDASHKDYWNHRYAKLLEAKEYFQKDGLREALLALSHAFIAVSKELSAFALPTGEGEESAGMRFDLKTNDIRTWVIDSIYEIDNQAKPAIKQKVYTATVKIAFAAPAGEESDAVSGMLTEKLMDELVDWKYVSGPDCIGEYVVEELKEGQII